MFHLSLLQSLSNKTRFCCLWSVCAYRLLDSGCSGTLVSDELLVLLPWDLRMKIHLRFVSPLMPLMPTYTA